MHNRTTTEPRSGGCRCRRGGQKPGDWFGPGTGSRRNCCCLRERSPRRDPAHSPGRGWTTRRGSWARTCRLGSSLVRSPPHSAVGATAETSSASETTRVATSPWPWDGAGRRSAGPRNGQWHRRDPPARESGGDRVNHDVGSGRDLRMGASTPEVTNTAMARTAFAKRNASSSRRVRRPSQTGLLVGPRSHSGQRDPEECSDSTIGRSETPPARRRYSEDLLSLNGCGCLSVPQRLRLTLANFLGTARFRLVQPPLGRDEAEINPMTRTRHSTGDRHPET